MKEQTQYVDKPLIKNTILETIFMDDATDEQMATYVRLATSENEHATAQATAFASKNALIWHRFRKDREQRLGIDHEYQAHVLFDRSKGRRAA
jgi:hypothetical protein